MLHFKSPPLRADHHHHSVGQALGAPLCISTILQLGLFNGDPAELLAQLNMLNPEINIWSLSWNILLD